jgi:protein-glutamine gamma-glutamyltransferase
MTFAQYFRTSSYGLIGSGFLAIAATGSIDWFSIILFSSIFISSWFLNTIRIRQRVPSWALNGIGFTYFLFSIIDYRLLSHSFLIVMLHLLFFMAAVKLLTLSKDSDYLLLYLISFAELLAASTLTVSLVFVFCLFIFLFSGISTLILFEMRRTNARMQNEAKVQPLVTPRQLRGTGFELFSPFPAGLLSAMVIGFAVLILVVAIPIFFLLPRVNLGMYKRPSGKMQFTSGFSERVELGQIGTIKQSAAVVMRVKTDKPAEELPLDLKWRGIAFDYYDGRAWRRTDQAYHTIPVQGWYYKLQNSTHDTNLIRQTFFIEALSTNVVFAMHKALAVSQDVGVLWRDSSESLYTDGHLSEKLRYSAVSDPIRPDTAIISDLRPIPPEILKTYTQVPPGDSRISELAKEVTRTAGDRYAKARALEKHLRTHYSYSLVLRSIPNSRDPLATFLFDIKKGHCEYFASAMAIMLRHLGIPARLVNGFRSGEYNDLGKNWIVRQYDAHSWVEGYFPPYGWTEFDPTPPDPPHPKSKLLRMISNLNDAIDLWWWEGVVNYDRSKQYRMIDGVRTGMEYIQRQSRSLAEFVQKKTQTGIASIGPRFRSYFLIQRWAMWLPGIVVALLLAIKPLRKRILSLIRRTLYRGNPRILVASFYTEALALLGAQGIKRSYGQTPMEFAHSLEDHPAGSPFLSLTRMYNAVRFGPPGTSFHHLEALALLHSLRKALRKPAKIA